MLYTNLPPTALAWPEPATPASADGRAHFDYQSWEGTRELTATLLQHDFGIAWSLPEGQLVPPLTNRSNYLHWINDLLHLSAPATGRSARTRTMHVPRSRPATRTPQPPCARHGHRLARDGITFAAMQ